MFRIHSVDQNSECSLPKPPGSRWPARRLLTAWHGLADRSVMFSDQSWGWARYPKSPQCRWYQWIQMDTLVQTVQTATTFMLLKMLMLFRSLGCWFRNGLTVWWLWCLAFLSALLWSVYTSSGQLWLGQLAQPLPLTLQRFTAEHIHVLVLPLWSKTISHDVKLHPPRNMENLLRGSLTHEYQTILKSTPPYGTCEWGATWSQIADPVAYIARSPSLPGTTPSTVPVIRRRFAAGTLPFLKRKGLLWALTQSSMALRRFRNP